MNLSHALALRGQRVLLMDLDSQANCTSGLGIEAEPLSSIYPVLLGEKDIRDQFMQSGRENLTFVPSEMDLAGIEIELARSDDHLTRLRGILQGLKPNDLFDFCILDTPPSLGVLMTAALAAADEILIPLQCEWFGLEGLAKIVGVLDEIRGSGANPGLKLEGIVMTMYDGRTNLSKQVVEEVTNYFPDEIYQNVIPRTIRISEAPSHGKTIFEHDPNSQGAAAYDRMAEEFLVRHARVARCWPSCRVSGHDVRSGYSRWKLALIFLLFTPRHRRDHILPFQQPHQIQVVNQIRGCPPDDSGVGHDPI